MSDYIVPVVLWLIAVPAPLATVAGAFWYKRRRDFRDSLEAMELELKWMGTDG
jgi:hypothetical protein